MKALVLLHSFLPKEPKLEHDLSIFQTWILIVLLHTYIHTLTYSCAGNGGGGHWSVGYALVNPSNRKYHCISEIPRKMKIKPDSKTQIALESNKKWIWVYGIACTIRKWTGAIKSVKSDDEDECGESTYWTGWGRCWGGWYKPIDERLPPTDTTHFKLKGTFSHTLQFTCSWDVSEIGMIRFKEGSRLERTPDWSHWRSAAFFFFFFLLTLGLQIFVEFLCFTKIT